MYLISFNESNYYTPDIFSFIHSFIYFVSYGLFQCILTKVTSVFLCYILIDESAVRNVFLFYKKAYYFVYNVWIFRFLKGLNTIW